MSVEAEGSTEQLLYNLKTGNHPRDGSLENELLSRFFHGEALDQLRPLLSSTNDDVVQSAAFIVSELGAEGKLCLDIMQRLLGHPRKHVRYYALQSLLETASERNGDSIVAALTLLDDGECGIRTFALDFLSRLSPVQRTAAIEYCKQKELRTPIQGVLRWLDSDDSWEASEIVQYVNSNVRSHRLAGAAAAWRLAQDEERWPLSVARHVADDDISQFAELAWHQLPNSQ